MKVLYRPSLFFSIVFLLQINGLHAQKVTTFQSEINILFGKTPIVSSGGNITSGIAQLPDKGFLVAGTSYGQVPVTGQDFSNIVVFKTDSLGQLKWIKGYGYRTANSQFDSYRMIQLSDSDYVISGRYADSAFLLKIDKGGNIIWNRILGYFFPSALNKTANGGFMVSGYHGSTLVGLSYDNNGKRLWGNMFQIEDTITRKGLGVKINSVKPASDGGYYGAAQIYDEKGYPKNGHVIFKTDSAWKLKWIRFWLDSAAECVSTDIIEHAGYVYVTGHNSAKFSFMKLDLSGNLVWAKGCPEIPTRIGGNTIIFDKRRNEFLITCARDTSSPIIVSKEVLLTADTSGHFKKIFDYKNSGYSGTQSGANILTLANGYAMAAGTVFDFFLIKTDTALNTHDCDIRNIPPSTYNISVVDLPIKDTTGGLVLANDSIVLPVGNIISTNHVYCLPFVSWFVWQDTCSGAPTHFIDSTYLGATTWYWHFGDPASGKLDTSTAQKPAHIYQKAGKYKVTLVVTNGTNTDSVSRVVTIAPSPIYQYKDTAVCLGDSVPMAFPGYSGYRWEPSQYLTDSIRPATIGYPSSDTRFSVNFENKFGCTVTDSEFVTVNIGNKCPKPASISGIINHYSSVTSFDTCSYGFTVDSAGWFSPGDTALLIQMKGAGIDTSTKTVPGDVKDIANAGHFEYVVIDSVSTNSVYLRYKLLKSYDATGTMQLVTVPRYGNVLVSGTLKAGPWDGNKGGILIFQSSGSVYLNAPIDASGAGFAGGSLSNGSFSCHEAGYYYHDTLTAAAYKGEGISILPLSLAKGRGTNANGGGGADSYQAGGGGGAGYGDGGRGGKEFANCFTAINNGGLGGAALKSYFGQNRVFLGGGGGAGFESGTSRGTAGVPGGGIVIINAFRLVGGGQRIVSQGASQLTDAPNAGAGGGGAGGSIWINVPNLSSRLQVDASGGNGGNTAFSRCLGPGGGGGGGVLLLTSGSLPNNVHYSAYPGLPGENTNSTVSCYGSSYGADSGRSGGIISGISQVQGSIPVKRAFAVLLSASVLDNSRIKLEFLKSVSPNVIGYRIYRRLNSDSFRLIATVMHPKTTLVSFIDTISTLADTFGYQVYAFDTCGHTPGYAAIHRAVHASATSQGCMQIVHLNWSKYVGWPVKKYEVYRSTDGGPEILLTANINNPSHDDSTVDYHHKYCYRIKAYEAGDTNTSWSQQVCSRTFEPDTAKLLWVSTIATSAVNGAVRIHWQNIANRPHMAATALFGSPDGKHYSLLKLVPATMDSFTDVGVNTQTGNRYYYTVNIDSCGNRSDSSTVHRTIDLSISIGELLHKLDWTPYQGFKVKTYYIRKYINGVFTIIDSVPGTDTFSRQFPAPCNYAIKYRIDAVGFQPGQISMSDTEGRRAIDTIAPRKAPLVNLMLAANGDINLHFATSPDADIYHYVVEKNENGVWATAATIDYNKSMVNESFSGKLSQLSQGGCYTVITLDSCLNATPGDTICTTRLKTSALFCSKMVKIGWSATPLHITAPDSVTVYRSSGAAFTSVARVPAQTGSYSDTNVTIGQPYRYYTVAKYPGGYKSYSDTLTATPELIPTAGNAQLVYASVLKTDGNFGMIYLQWRRSPIADTNARGYYIYAFDTVNGKYTLLKNDSDLNDTSFIHKNINTQDFRYKYYIITYNVCETGSSSVIHGSVLLDVGNFSHLAKLNWTNYLGLKVKEYSIYKSVDGGPPVLLKNTVSDSLLFDSTITCGHTYTYQVQAMLTNGKVSFSDSVTIKGFDTLRPATKPIIRVTVTGTSVVNGKTLLSWLPSPKKNILGYNVYRSIDGVNWVQVASHLPGLSFADSGLDTHGQAYDYRVQPVDSCQNRGDYASLHRTILAKATPGNQLIRLNWNAYIGWKTAKYLIFKNGVQVASVGGDTLSFNDTNVICHIIYNYQVQALCDTSLGLISVSNTDSAASYDNIAPPKIYITTVTVSDPNRAATISWAPSPADDLKNYYIFRKSATTGDMRLLDSTDQTTFTDSTFLIHPINPIYPIHEPDCYYVFAHDHCGNISPGSNEGCIIVLNAKNETGFNTLDWNGYKTWYDGVRSYNIYKKEDNNGWNFIGATSNGNTQNFTDKNLGDSTINFCYQVEAIENPGKYNQLSRSTTVCVHQDATIFIPNSFTASNGDGLNDKFGPIGLHIKNYHMQVYNRWGELIYNTNTGQSWDGTFRGEMVQQGVYIYLIDIEDYNKNISHFSGNITIFR